MCCLLYCKDALPSLLYSSDVASVEYCQVVPDSNPKTKICLPDPAVKENESVF